MWLVWASTERLMYRSFALFRCFPALLHLSLPLFSIPIFLSHFVSPIFRQPSSVSQFNLHVKMLKCLKDMLTLHRTQMQFDACIPLCVFWTKCRWTVYTIRQIDSCKVLPNNGRMTCARSTITINYWKHKLQQRQQQQQMTFFSFSTSKRNNDKMPSMCETAHNLCTSAIHNDGSHQ